jgi:hypothetical protein
MPESRFFKIIIVVLLLINIGTLGFLWLGRERPRQHMPPPPPPEERPDGPGRPGGAAAFLREQLQLTEAQETAYRKMREQHHATVVAIRDEMKEHKKALYTLLKSADSNIIHTDEQRWLDSLAAAQRRIEMITYRHFREVRALCSPQQQQKFDQVIGEALEQMR